jgi:hypothetical protein
MHSCAQCSHRQSPCARQDARNTGDAASAKQHQRRRKTDQHTADQAL